MNFNTQSFEREVGQDYVDALQSGNSPDWAASAALYNARRYGVQYQPLAQQAIERVNISLFGSK